MRNAKRTILIAMLFWVVSMPVCSAGTARNRPKPPHPTAFELLDRYAETQDKLKSFIIKGQTITESSMNVRLTSPTPTRADTKTYRSWEVRFDGQRVNSRVAMWGNATSPTDWVPESRPAYKSHLWTNKDYWRYSRGQTGLGRVVINQKQNAWEIERLQNGHPACWMTGVYSGSMERLDKLISEARKISVRDKTEKIKGVKCYVIDADTKCGEYTVWIDPEHGYNVAKAKVELSQGKKHFFYRRPFDSKKLSWYMNNVRFEKTDDVWVPVEADGYYERIFKADGCFAKSKTHLKATEIILNPDHEALGSFVPADIKNGAKVYIKQVPGVHYTWQDGQVVDENGRVIMDCRPKKASGSAESKPKSAVRKRPSAWELLRRYAEQQAKVTASRSKERIVHFPNDRSLGKLFISDENARSEIRGFGYDIEGTKWERFGQAQGDVTIPAGKRLQLILSSWTWEKPDNLSALRKLKPDDIYSLILSHKWSRGKRRPNDRCMPYVAHLTGLKTLNLWGANITSRGLEYITEIKSLERLYLPARVNNSGMVYVGKLKSLKVLYFGGNNFVTNDGLAQLSNLKSLEELALRSVRMTDQGLKYLSGLPHLRYLILGGNFTNDAFLYLKDVPSLRTLSIGIMEIGGRDPKSRPCLITRFNDEGMKNVSGLRQLENFGAAWMEGITDKGVAHLKNMPSLKKLGIGHAHLTDRAMLDLKQIRTLEWLHLPNDGLTDAGLKHIAELQNLRYLWVSGSSISPLTDESLRYVGKLKNLERLYIGGAGFGDKGMKHIAQLTNLRDLILFKAGDLTNKGLAELAKLKCLTKLHLGRGAKISVSGLKSLNSLKKLKDLTIQNVKQDNSIMDISGLTALEDLSIGLHRKYKGGTIVYESSFQDKDLACLANLTRLKKLWLSGAGISDEGIRHLSGLTNLESLGIVGQCRITDVGLKHLANMQKLYRLQIMDGHFSDRALQYLENLPSLYWLELTSDNAFSKRAIKRFKEKNPNLTQLQLVP